MFVQTFRSLASYFIFVSTNQLEICAALSAVNKIVTEDMIPAVIGDVPFFLFQFQSKNLILHNYINLYLGYKTIKT